MEKRRQDGESTHPPLNKDQRRRWEEPRAKRRTINARRPQRNGERSPLPLPLQTMDAAGEEKEDEEEGDEARGTMMGGAAVAVAMATDGLQSHSCWGDVWWWSRRRSRLYRWAPLPSPLYLNASEILWNGNGGPAPVRFKPNQASPTIFSDAQASGTTTRSSGRSSPPPSPRYRGGARDGQRRHPTNQTPHRHKY